MEMTEFHVTIILFKYTLKKVDKKKCIVSMFEFVEDGDFLYTAQIMNKYKFENTSNFEVIISSNHFVISARL